LHIAFFAYIGVRSSQSNLTKATSNPLHLAGRDENPYNVSLGGSPAVSTPNKMSIHSAVVAQPTRVTDRVTDVGIIDCNSPASVFIICGR